MLDRPDFQQALRFVFEEKIPFCRTLGLKLEVADGAPRVHIARQDFMLGNTRLEVLHGGVTAAVLDSIAGVAIMLRMVETDPKPDLETQLREFARLSTIDLRVDYLEPASAAAFVATANVTRLGTRIANVQMALTDDAGRRRHRGRRLLAARAARLRLPAALSDMVGMGYHKLRHWEE
jgi:uncharacterized protein (TIGR00369 family)